MLLLWYKLFKEVFKEEPQPVKVKISTLEDEVGISGPFYNQPVAVLDFGDIQAKNLRVGEQAFNAKLLDKTIQNKYVFNESLRDVIDKDTFFVFDRTNPENVVKVKVL